MTIAIDIEGPVFSQISFAHVVRSLAFALDDLGCRVSVQATDAKSQGYKAVATETNFDRLTTLVARKPEGRVKILYNFPVNMANRCKGYNFAITSWETTRPPEPWIQDLNKHADQAWAISSFVNEVFIQSGLNKKKARVLKMGVDPSIFCPAAEPVALNTKKKFKFLHLGVAQERKGTPLLLRAYAKAFSQKDDVCLVIKSNGLGVIDQWIKEARSPAEILYIYEESHEEKIAGYYSATDCFVYPVHAEGAGLPVLESLAVGKPAIVPLWSGLTDFCNENNSFPIAHKLSKLQIPYSRYPGKGVELWADLNEEDLIHQLRYAYEHRDIVRKKGEYAASYINQNFSWHNTAVQALNYIAEFVEDAKHVAPRIIPPTPPPPKAIQKNNTMRVGVLSHFNPVLESCSYASTTLSSSFTESIGLAPFGTKKKHSMECFNYGLLSATSLVDTYRKENLDLLEIHWDRYLISPKRLSSFVRQLSEAALNVCLFLHDSFTEQVPPDFFFQLRFVFVNSVKSRNAMLGKGCPLDRIRYLKPFQVALPKKVHNLRSQLKIGPKNLLIFCPNLTTKGMGTKEQIDQLAQATLRLPHAKIFSHNHDPDGAVLAAMGSNMQSSDSLELYHEADAFFLAGKESHNPFLVPCLFAQKPIFMYEDFLAADLEGVYPLNELKNVPQTSRQLPGSDEYVRLLESMYYTVKNSAQPVVSINIPQTNQVIENDFDPDSPMQFAEL